MPAAAAQLDAPSAAPFAAAPSALDPSRRLTYYMLLRVAVSTLLLASTVLANIISPAVMARSNTGFLFAMIGCTYALTLGCALSLRRGVSPGRLAAVQLAGDGVVTMLLVHADGGADSVFVLLFLILVVGACMAMPRRPALVISAAAAGAYLVLSLVDRFGLVPSWPGEPGAPLVLDGLQFAFVVGKNLVLFPLTTWLARRLAGELERADEQIAEQGARFDDLAVLHADVVRSLSSGLLTLSDDGVVRSLNPAGEEILGRVADSIVGRPLAQCLPEMSGYVTTATLGNKGRGEVELHQPDGERRVVGLSIAPLLSAHGQAVGRIVNFQDLTQLRRMQQQIERTERLAAIGRLAAGVAHEIRNPLAAISGSIELLSNGALSTIDDESRELMEIVTREVDRLNRLITDLLDFARPRPPASSALEVSATLGEILRVVENDRRLNPMANRFQLQIPQPVWLEADPAQLRQVVLNLLINAADATPDGEPVELWAGADGQRVRIEIRDRGPGIPPDVKARIFEPFFTTKKGGTGLGLATVHRIVEEHQGSIEVDDRPGGGTVFTVWMPRRDPPSPSAG